MCGIFGIFITDSTRPVNLQGLQCMSDTLIHRGPDGGGHYTDGALGIGMRRLSIIDLQTGNQPMSNEDGSVWVVFNGEIYNYRQLTAALVAKGHRFATASDTEVLVHLYEEYGSTCVEHLRGMFAFALWDRSTQTLLAARDRLGIKPLYYSLYGGKLVFGSELKTLLADPDMPREIDLQGLAAYLRYGYIADPRTILKGVQKLPPGHLLVAQGKRVEVKPYWDVLPFFLIERCSQSEIESREELAELLCEAIRLRLVSDVPIGAFLSGGIDSSMVVTLMARSLNYPVKTFSIGFEEEAFNELPYAREVARHLGTDHHELVLCPESVDIISKIVWHFDEPFGDPSALPTYYVSKLARESVKVVLSGDGGDELFGGYDRYSQHLSRAFADQIPAFVKQRMLRPLSGLLPDGVSGKRLIYNLSLPPVERYLDSISYFAPRFLQRILNQDVIHSLDGDGEADYVARIRGLDRVGMLSRMQALDFKTYLPGDILVKVDRMSMAHSLEARVPLLDHKFVEYVAGLPATLKVRGCTSKYLFKQIARDYLPARIIDRRKQGFAVPLQRWFKEDLSRFFRDILLDPKTQQRSYFEPKKLRAFVDQQDRARQPTHLWMLTMLELWHRVILEGPRQFDKEEREQAYDSFKNPSATVFDASTSLYGR